MALVEVNEAVKVLLQGLTPGPPGPYRGVEIKKTKARAQINRAIVHLLGFCVHNYHWTALHPLRHPLGS